MEQTENPKRQLSLQSCHGNNFQQFDQAYLLAATFVEGPDRAIELLDGRHFGQTASEEGEAVPKAGEGIEITKSKSGRTTQRTKWRLCGASVA